MARFASQDLIVFARSGDLFAVRFDPDNLQIVGEELPVIEDVGGDPSSGLRETDARRGEWQVSPNLGAYPRWSGDGRRLFFIEIGTPSRPLMVVDVLPGESFSVGPPETVVDNLGRAFVTSTAPATNWDVSPSGDRYVFVELERRAQAAGEVEAALNWVQNLGLDLQ